MNTLFDKIWDKHVVQVVADGPTQLYIDRLYCHEVTSPQAFEGLRELTGCTVKNPELAGWRYGFVSYNSDGTTIYSDVWSAEDTENSFDVPANSQYLWFVVTGAPSKYIRHPWGNDDSKPLSVWPWKARFSETKPYGK